jgi:hypothetical protein
MWRGSIPTAALLAAPRCAGAHEMLGNIAILEVADPARRGPGPVWTTEVRCGRVPRSRVSQAGFHDVLANGLCTQFAWNSMLSSNPCRST